MLYFSSALLLAAACLFVSTGAHKATTCGNHVHRLSCETGVIIVQNSLYGRADRVTCAGGKTAEEIANTACSLEGADDIINTRCNGKKVCEVTPAIFTTDPCRDTFKYLETSYSCVPAIHLIACEHSLAHLQCDAGQIIHVYHADFGRQDPNICSFRRDSAQLQNVMCSRPTNKVAERCNGSNSCSIQAECSVLGNACPNTYKYLELTYTCQQA
ncbi:L-rhamnose-binding lectin SML-like [Archocentrus centrarchus]|uniref:L-rhamnose-binding lectin SML-like n=1 Tax=Archocentrus centrarchus TaxID=63155 RepID=UPI0011E9F0EE|nr:L-rhamnose-binding lectin SML-like [Archocentrus centrarchus]